MDRDELRGTIRACLLGGAVGETVGYPVDGWSRDRIVESFGGPVTGPVGTPEIADGTQLTLFTVEGLLRAQLRFEDRGLCDPRAVVWRSYQRWALTQGIETTMDWDFPDLSVSWMLDQPELRRTVPLSSRCRQVLADADSYPSVKHPANRSDGSGAIMRVAPAGLSNPADRAVDVAVWLAALTHGHPRAHAASAAYAAIVALLAGGAPLDVAVEVACKLSGRLPGSDAVPVALERVLTLAWDRSDDGTARSELGSGRTSLSALLHAVCCVASSDSFEHAVLRAVYHDGASATPSALTGQLAALVYGIDAIPAGWRDACPVDALIETLASDWAAILDGAGLHHVYDKGYRTF